MSDVIHRVVWVPLEPGKTVAQVKAVEATVGEPFHWDGHQIDQVKSITVAGIAAANMTAIRLECGTEGHHCVVMTNSRVDAVVRHDGGI